MTLAERKLLQAAFRGQIVPKGSADEVELRASKEYGASYALLALAKQLGLDRALYSRKQGWVQDGLAMIVGRLIYAGSKLALSNQGKNTALWDLCGTEGKVEVEQHCYEPMDQLLERQSAIQRTLAARHLQDGHLVLYDITSSYFEGAYPTVSSSPSATVGMASGGTNRWSGHRLLERARAELDKIAGSRRRSSAPTPTPSPGMAYSLFNSTELPGTVTDPDTLAQELGVKFQSSVAGKITAIRFYKSWQNTGTHTAHLWNASGALLASATFTSETASGSSNGNGVYALGSGTLFPQNTWKASNYWVDVVFTAN